MPQKMNKKTHVVEAELEVVPAPELVVPVPEVLADEDVVLEAAAIEKLLV